ncbi:MAG: hypothetical protein REI64_10685 [Pedobacter sp.]|uniref:hypothetical protein n=1 Tax=Pedobacter sp. TaxID=1411316 RepID=UPI0028087428|nr:hypothetical protein [Pedobacter sp.]MDQ8005256.1 hypothetical protein [Pedobacter sp.]
MKNTINLLNHQRPIYNDLYIRMLMSLLAAHYILTHTSKYGFFEIVLVNGYLYSLAISFFIAFLLFQLVYALTTQLDKRYPYLSNWKIRLVLQVLIGIGVVAIIAFLSAYIFFYANNVTERIPRYFNHDFPMIMAYIIGMNVYYMIRQGLLVNRFLFDRVHSLTEETPKKAPHRTKLAERKTDRKIAFVLKKDRQYMVTYADGSTFAWFKSIKRTMEELSLEEYFAINPTCIISKNVILSIKPIQSKRYAITLKPDFHKQVNPENFIVSQANKKRFTAWFTNNHIH